MMSIRILAVITLSLFANIVNAKIVISGHVVNEDNEPVDVATTKLVDGEGKMLYFQITDESGYFEYVIDVERLDANLIVECLGYEAYKLNVTTSHDITNMSIRLKSKSTELKEVIVTAPSVVLQGDTISYRLSAFAGKGDITLKDAMRNLPGIDISDNGKIKYLGKEISNFYIEGMDLLGGRYNVATDNLPVSSVSNVEILNNHQSVKMDKEIFSDNVAINVKLSSKAKFRPVGSYEFKGGYGDDWLYQLSGAGMMFNNKFQSILNAKYGNITEFAEDANMDHYNESETLYSATQLLGDLGLSTPPLDRERFVSPEDCFITLNMLNKTGKDATFRANAGYSYTKTRYDYLSFRDYYGENGSVHINQEQSSMSAVHRPTVSLEYKLNSSNKYLTNTFIGNVGIKEIAVPSVLDGSKFSQDENIKDFQIRNDFTSSWRANNLRWNITSRIEYGSTPKGYVKVTDQNDENCFVQAAKSHRFLTKETLSAAYEHKYSRFWMPLSVLYSNNVIKSELNNPASSNNAVGNNIQLWFAPLYEYIHPMRKYVVRASANLKWEYNDVENKGSMPVRKTNSRFTISPYLYFNWTISPSSTLRSQISYLNRTGDIGDFLTAPVRTDNLNISYKTGILSYKQSFNAMLHYDFKLPLDMWFVNADLIYDNSRSNLITNSDITDSSIEVSSIPYPNNLENFTGMLNLTKMFSSINTKISLGGAYMWGRNSVSQDEIIRLNYSHSYSILTKIITKPWSFIELDYDGNMTTSHIKYENIANSLMSHSHCLKLNLFPFKGFQVKMGADILWKELSENVSKTIGLIDLGMSYKFSYYRIGIDMNNILNTRHYSYTIFSGINQFSYDYSLRGREVLISFSFTR